MLPVARSHLLPCYGSPGPRGPRTGRAGARPVRRCGRTGGDHFRRPVVWLPGYPGSAQCACSCRQAFPDGYAGEAGDLLDIVLVPPVPQAPARQEIFDAAREDRL